MGGWANDKTEKLQVDLITYLMIAMKTQFGDKAMKCPLSFDSIDLITFNYYVYIDRARGICGLVWAEL